MQGVVRTTEPPEALSVQAVLQNSGGLTFGVGGHGQRSQ